MNRSSYSALLDQQDKLSALAKDLCPPKSKVASWAAAGWDTSPDSADTDERLACDTATTLLNRLRVELNATGMQWLSGTGYTDAWMIADEADSEGDRSRHSSSPCSHREVLSSTSLLRLLLGTI